MKAKDFYSKNFIGTDYEIGEAKTVGDIRNELETILSDLPEDSSLKVDEFYLDKNKLCYTLSEGITQHGEDEDRNVELKK